SAGAPSTRTMRSMGRALFTGPASNSGLARGCLDCLSTVRAESSTGAVISDLAAGADVCAAETPPATKIKTRMTSRPTSARTAEGPLNMGVFLRPFGGAGNKENGRAQWTVEREGPEVLTAA